MIDFNLIEELKGKTVLVTGATGLIGYNIISALLDGKEEGYPKIIAFARNKKKADEMFGKYKESGIKIVVSDICDSFNIDGPIDYIIHGASQTASKAFIDEPVETIETAIKGTLNILELAKEKKIKSLVYLSSMEVYGSPLTDDKISETYGTSLNTMLTRSSYPESKRMCESLCASYCAEYGVPAKVVRLTQTFGPGVRYDDSRVFAEFARCAIEGKNIVLNTKGETKRNYLYTEDAATAILTVLLKGEDGEAYNAANEETYCSIYEMAKLVAEKCAKGKIDVEIRPKDIDKFGYAPTLKMNLDTSKLRKLGWQANVNLEDMFNNLIDYMIKNC